MIIFALLATVSLAIITQEQYETRDFDWDEEIQWNEGNKQCWVKVECRLSGGSLCGWGGRIYDEYKTRDECLNQEVYEIPDAF